jgi:leukotriene-A4 hydrolase
MDPCSLSNSNDIRITHVDLSLTSDMHSKVIHGKALYRYRGESNVIILDTNYIEILESSHPYSLEPLHPVFGRALRLELQSPEGAFSLKFRTSPSSTAVQFMAPSQTAGKTYGFCYTQCQAIHCRSLFPVQDTPRVKFTIDYHISVPAGLAAVAAGIFQSITESIPGYNVYHFTQQVPIPSYLVAFAVGNIVSRSIGPNSTLYSEPELIDSAAAEFSDINQMLKSAESIMTPYFWGKLDLLLLPPSFPFGGMENPNLIFVTPTILAGDKSLTNVVAHEIAHSWTGNAVTNSTWEHFWLNEGFTVYFERKITREVFGTGRAELEQIYGLTYLKKTVDLLGNDHNFTRLNLNLDGIDPDDSFSCIPYEKGCCFLLYLESLVGEDAFLQFLREYITEYKGKNIDSNEFKDLFTSKFPLDIDWEVWLRGTGYPPWVPTISNSLLDKVKDLYNSLDAYSPSLSDIEGWNTEQTIAFLDLLLESPSAKYIEIGEIFKLNTNNNSEIKLLWLTLVIRTNAEKYYSDVVHFASSQGRMKYVRPLFRELHANGLKAIADKIFSSSRDFYHSTLVSLLCKEFSYN